jgi:hypothetical protein
MLDNVGIVIGNNIVIANLFYRSCIAKDKKRFQSFAIGFYGIATVPFGQQIPFKSSETFQTLGIRN